MVNHRTRDHDDPPRPPARPRTAVRLVHRSRRSRPAPAPPILPVIGADDVILPAFEARLAEVARRARAGDAEARDALYLAFRPKLDRLAHVVRPPFAPDGATGVWDRDDVAQEGYLVFVELLLAWPDDVALTSYLMSRFPWRLRDAVRRGVGRPSIPPRRTQVPVEDAELLADAEEPPHAVRALLAAITAGLSPAHHEVLVALALRGKTQTEVAAALGVSRRTVYRYWQELRRQAREVLVPRGEAGEGEANGPDDVQ